MAITPFRRQKLERMFALLDLDRDGVIDETDFLRRVDAFARLRAWDRDSAIYLRNAVIATDEWENLRQGADSDDDGKVTRDEFLGYAERFLEDRDAVRAYARGDVQLLFDAMDRDVDSRLAVDEYREYLEVCRADPIGAERFFAHADLDRDGRITRAEFAHAFEEFYLSDDPSSVGNHLFGQI